MLSILLVGIGTAQARLSANDFVPGQDVVVPMVCEGTLDAQNNPIFGTLNTLVAIAEMRDGTPLAAPYEDYVTVTSLEVFDRTTTLVWDDERIWTPYDVVVDNCQDIVLAVPSAERPNLRVDMPLQGGGVISLFVLEVVYSQTSPQVPLNRFLPWVYLVDLSKGFASGFNGISAENGIGPQLGEDGINRPVTMESIFPRFFLLNGLADTWNWWMLLFGRNELGVQLPANYTSSRDLTGFICDEEELCRSISIPIPYELNLIDVLSRLPNDIKTACNFPTDACGGFARLSIFESGTEQSVPQTFTITGTANGLGALPLADPPEFYSGYGWSYQRAADSTATLSWDVIHEIHRIYCSGSGTGVAQGGGNAVSCDVTVTP